MVSAPVRTDPLPDHSGAEAATQPDETCACLEKKPAAYGRLHSLGWWGGGRHVATRAQIRPLRRTILAQPLQITSSHEGADDTPFERAEQLWRMML